MYRALPQRLPVVSSLRLVDRLITTTTWGVPPGSASGKSDKDEADVTDCNLNGPALAAIGRALGLHTEEDESDSDSGSDSEEDGGAAEREMPVKKRPGKEKEKETGPAKEAGEDKEDGEGGMTLSDLVWW